MNVAATLPAHRQLGSVVRLQVEFCGPAWVSALGVLALKRNKKRKKQFIQLRAMFTSQSRLCVLAGLVVGQFTFSFIPSAPAAAGFLGGQYILVAI